MISKHQICALKKLYQFLTMKPYLHSSLVYFTQMESVTANCAHISNAEKNLNKNMTTTTNIHMKKKIEELNFKGETIVYNFLCQ